MSSVEEGGLQTSKTTTNAATRDVEVAQVPTMNGWLYRRIRLGSWKGTYYASPLTQVILVSLICFLDPGMSNALSGLGGGGQLNPTVANNATVATYSTFAGFAFFSGSICNFIGLRWSLVLGGFGYSVGTASYICYNHTGNSGFVIFGGALGGFSAALLWTAQGTIVMSYPPEDKKGRYISICWAIFNTGAVIGSLIPLGQAVNGADSGTVSDGTYAAFVALMFLGSTLGLALVSTDKVVREDGSKVVNIQHPSWKTELLGLWETLRTDTFIVLLFPMFISSNWFYTYQFNDFNLAHFNLRTRSLNNVIYWFMQIIGSFAMGSALDWARFSRRMRARGAWMFLVVFTLALWGSALKYQIGFTRANVAPLPDERLDWSSPGYGGMLVLYLFWGVFDSAWQTSIYWYMGALTNNARKLAIYAGFYKSAQSAGAAICYRLDALAVPYAAMFGAAWGWLVVGLIFAWPIVWFKVKDHTEVTQNLEISHKNKSDFGSEKVAAEVSG